ncbi:MAG: YhfZ family protein [Propionicimonas sp.]|nr:YhfZ family protein [Propionicimonas sp.]
MHAAVRAVVLDALSKRVGDTLTKNTDFREALGVGVGTVQRALDLLADRGALQTVSRGHLGRRIESVDIGQSWQAAGLPPVQITLSPPGSVEIDGIEAWLGRELVRLGVPYTLTHVRGGNHRLDLLDRGESDLTVVSAGTFDGLRAARDLPSLDIERKLGPGTYYSPERLLVLTTREPAVEGELRRIAIDRESFDHEALTLAQFPPRPGREYAQVPFPEVPAFVLAGLVDAGVWHQLASAVPLELTGLKYRPMWGDSAGTRDRLSGATIVARSERGELRAVVDSLILETLPSHRDAAIAREQAMAARLASAIRASSNR